MIGGDQKGHSEEYFSDYRDHWWNNDFLELMATRWGLREYSSLLDVGCGEFHWSSLLSPHMKSPNVIGIDNDSKWSNNDLSKIRKKFHNVNRLELLFGSAESIPFPDNSFDVVTCQTVLIHVADPAGVIREMKRVTKKGGIVICAEPNNMATCLSIDSSASIHKVSETLESAKICLYEQYGKYLNGEGYNSVGDLVPLFFHSSGLTNIKTYLSDKCVPLIPPYRTEEQLATIRSMKRWLETEDANFDSAGIQARVRKAESVLGDIGLNVAMQTERSKKDTKNDLEQQSLYSPGSAIMYLVSGVKS